MSIGDFLGEVGQGAAALVNQLGTGTAQAARATAALGPTDDVEKALLVLDGKAASLDTRATALQSNPAFRDLANQWNAFYQGQWQPFFAGRGNLPPDPAKTQGAQMGAQIQQWAGRIGNAESALKNDQDRVNVEAGLVSMDQHIQQDDAWVRGLPDTIGRVSLVQMKNDWNGFARGEWQPFFDSRTSLTPAAALERCRAYAVRVQAWDDRFTQLQPALNAANAAPPPAPAPVPAPAPTFTTDARTPPSPPVVTPVVTPISPPPPHPLPPPVVVPGGGAGIQIQPTPAPAAGNDNTGMIVGVGVGLAILAFVMSKK